MGSEEPGKDSPPLTHAQLRVIDRVRASRPMPHHPRPLERMRWYDWLSMVLLCVLALALAYQLLVQPLGSGWSTGTSIVLGIAPLAGGVSAILARRRSAATIRAHKAFLCPHCHYGLAGCPDEGACPECGTLYHREELVRMWKSAYWLTDKFPMSAKETRER